MSDPDRPDDTAAAQEAAWRDIVAHYGDRIELTPDDLEDTPEEPAPDPPPPRPAQPDPTGDRVAERAEEHYTPPPPPPLPRPSGPRGLAWIALFGAPAVMLVCVVAAISLPGWAGFVLFAAFLGGFGYLVATMRRDDDSDDHGDDGAVV